MEHVLWNCNLNPSNPLLWLHIELKWKQRASVRWCSPMENTTKWITRALSKESCLHEVMWHMTVNTSQWWFLYEALWNCRHLHFYFRLLTGTYPWLSPAEQRRQDFCLAVRKAQATTSPLNLTRYLVNTGTVATCAARLSANTLTFFSQIRCNMVLIIQWGIV